MNQDAEDPLMDAIRSQEDRLRAAHKVHLGGALTYQLRLAAWELFVGTASMNLSPRRCRCPSRDEEDAKEEMTSYLEVARGCFDAARAFAKVASEEAGK